MSMSRQERFKFGFLLRCADDGCTPDEIRARVKVATFSLGDILGLKELLSGGASAAKTIAMLPVHAAAAGIGTAALGGAGVGWGAAKLQNDDVDPEEAKRHELIAAYKLQADKLRQQAATRSYRKPQISGPRLY